MSRIIPTSRPLSEADRLYLVQRCQSALIQRIDDENPPFSAEDDVIGELSDLRQADLFEDGEDGEDGEDDEDEDGEDDDDLIDESPDYTRLNVAELKVRLSRRGLDTNGKKTELVNRLLAYDQQ
jgi:hypothetical protein